MTSLQTSQQDGPEESARDGRAIAMSGELSGTVSGSADGGLNRSARHSSARSLSRADFNSKGANLVKRNKGRSVRRWFQALLVALLAVGLTVTGLVAGTQEARADEARVIAGTPTYDTIGFLQTIPLTLSQDATVTQLIINVSGDSNFYKTFRTDTSYKAFKVGAADRTDDVTMNAVKTAPSNVTITVMSDQGIAVKANEEILVQWNTGKGIDTVKTPFKIEGTVATVSGTDTETPDPENPENPTVDPGNITENSAAGTYDIPMTTSKEVTASQVVVTIVGDAGYYKNFETNPDVQKLIVGGQEVEATFDVQKTAPNTVRITASLNPNVHIDPNEKVILRWSGKRPNVGTITYAISAESGSDDDSPAATGEVNSALKKPERNPTSPESGILEYLGTKVTFSATQTREYPLNEVHLRVDEGSFLTTSANGALKIGDETLVLGTDYELRFDNDDVYFTLNEPRDIPANTVISATAYWRGSGETSANIWLYREGNDASDDPGENVNVDKCESQTIWATIKRITGRDSVGQYTYTTGVGEFDAYGKLGRHFDIPSSTLGPLYGGAPDISGADIAVDPDGQYLVVLEGYGQLAIYGLVGDDFGTLLGKIKLPNTVTASDYVVPPSGENVTVAGKKTYTTGSAWHGSDIMNSLAFSADGGLFIGGENGDTLTSLGFQAKNNRRLSTNTEYHVRQNLYKVTGSDWQEAISKVMASGGSYSVPWHVAIDYSDIESLETLLKTQGKLDSDQYIDGGFAGDYVTLNDGSIITTLHDAKGGADYDQSYILKFTLDPDTDRASELELVGVPHYDGSPLTGIYGIAKTGDYIYFAASGQRWYWTAESEWNSGDPSAEINMQGMYHSLDVSDDFWGDHIVLDNAEYPSFWGATGRADSVPCEPEDSELDFEKNAIDLSGNNTIDEPDGATTVSNPVADDNETYRKVAYDLVVTNSDAADGKYTLVDNPYLTEDVLPSYVRISQKDSAGKGGAISKEGNVTLQTKWLPLDDVYNPNVNGFASDETGTLEISREINKLKDSSSKSDEVSIDKGATHVYQVEFLYQMNPETEDTSTGTWDDLTCQGSKETVYIRRKGLQNEATLTNVSSGGTITKDDCVPIEQPKSFLEIKKVGADNNETPLDAEFALFQVNEKGKQVGKVISVGNAKEAKFSIPSDGYYAIQETVAPAGGYALLPGPVYLQVKTKSESDANTSTSTNVQRLYLMYLDTRGDDVESNDLLKPITGDNKGSQLPLIDLLDAEGEVVEAEDIDAGITKNADFVFQVQVADVTTGDLPESGGMGVFVPASIAVLLAAAAGAATRRKPLGVNGGRKARPKPRH